MEALLRSFPGLKDLPRIDLGLKPTPVERRTVCGVEILVKREDLCHPLYGGNKPRSLEFLLAGSPRRVLTYSSLSAHHAYATALHARRAGIPTDAILVRRGERGPLCEKVREEAARVREVNGVFGAAGLTLAWWRPGTRIIAPGGMSARGALGSMAALFEVEEVPEKIYVPLGTGVTASGILAGLMLRGARCEVCAVCVSTRVMGFRPLLWSRARRAIRLLRNTVPDTVLRSWGGVSLRVVPGGGEYGEVTPESKAAVEAARAQGLLLEPCYTGKTLAALLRDRAQGALLWDTYCPIGAAGDRARPEAPLPRRSTEEA